MFFTYTNEEHVDSISLYTYTLRLQRNILGKECEIWGNPRFKKKYNNSKGRKTNI